MTGPEHYLKAERLLAGRTIPADPDLGDPAEHHPPTPEELAAAQVHATLALAAATAMNGHDGNGMSAEDFECWDAAAGVAYVQSGGPAGE